MWMTYRVIGHDASYLLQRQEREDSKVFLDIFVGHSVEELRIFSLHASSSHELIN